MLKSEDWLAVWLGFLIIVVVLAGVRPQTPSFRWATDSGFAATAAENAPAADKLVKDAEAKGEKDLAAAAAALKTAIDGRDRGAIGSA
ncbi:MAG: putative sulfate exporter family transporter, partial [candidate division NC10 bacterium]